jgi:hypothetical protein
MSRFFQSVDKEAVAFETAYIAKVHSGEMLKDICKATNKIALVENLKEKLYCTMKTTIAFCNIQMMSKTGRSFAKFPKLSELHEKLFGVAPKKLHNSLNDVVVCLRCYYQLEFGADICILNAKIQKKMSELL